MRNKTETTKKCLLCDQTAKKRGLCSMHYERFRRASNQLPLHLRKDFEANLIASGKLLPNNPGGKVIDDEFSQIAMDMLKNEAKIVAKDAESLRNTPTRKKRPPKQ